ncbi:Polyadenylate-binding protein 2 [Binucleata daphniae]
MNESSEDDVKKLFKLQTKHEETVVHNDKNSIAITNLDPKTTKSDILSFLKSCGKVSDIFVKSNSNKNLPTKAYIEFKDISSVEIALALNKTILKGKIVNVSKKQVKKRIHKNLPHGAKNTRLKK